MAKPDTQKSYRESIAANTQKGELYRVRFKGDRTEYTGIPAMLPGMMAEDRDLFAFKVVEPKDKKGVFKCRMHNVKSMEKEPEGMS